MNIYHKHDFKNFNSYQIVGPARQNERDGHGNNDEEDAMDVDNPVVSH